jgi:hypothetical protein
VSISVSTFLVRANGSVRIIITGTDTVTSIVRADRNGTRPVRGRVALLPRAAPFDVFDFEAGIAGPLNYRITTSTGTVVETWATFDLPGAPAPLPIFTLPSVPEYCVTAEMVTGITAPRESSTTLHEIIGRPDPVAALGGLRSRRGRLSVWCADYASARELESLLERGQVVHYRQGEHSGLDMYFLVKALEPVYGEDSEEWIMNIDYAQVSAPAGDVLTDPTWTFAALAAAGGTFANVAAEYDNFSQLTVGEK